MLIDLLDFGGEVRSLHLLAGLLLGLVFGAAAQISRFCLRRAVAGVVGAFGRKYFQDVVRRDDKPTELWAALAENGFLGLTVPEEYGGAGLGNLHATVLLEELNCADASVGVTVAVHLSLVAGIIAKAGFVIGYWDESDVEADGALASIHLDAAPPQG